MEEIKQEVKTEEKPVIPDTTNLIDKADAVAKRMEEANKRAEELLTRQEAIAARMLLSGKSEAGQVMKTPEQLAQEKQAADLEATLKRFRR